MVLRFIGIIALLAAFETSASAFCRTTTCECKSDGALPEKNGLPQTKCGQPDGDCPRDEHGCRMTGTPIAWPGRCIGFSANLAGTNQLTVDELNASFDKAFQNWALVDCGGGKHPSIQVFTLRPTTCATSAYNKEGAPNVNSVYFTDNGWSLAKNPKDLDGVIAKTATHFFKTGEVIDADIALNSARHLFTVADEGVNYDLVSVLTHEVGHFLGIDHSDDANAVMFWQYGSGRINRELQEDDINAICTVYPPDREAACDPVPPGGLQDTCGPKPEIKAGCAVAPDGGPNNNGLVVAVALLGCAVRWKSKRGRTR